MFDDLVYGGPLTSGYRPGEITFSLGAVLPNLRYLPAHLIEAMPVLVLGLAGLGWMIGRWARLRRAGGEPAARARRDLGVGLALAASWFGVWGLYAAYTWTSAPGPAPCRSSGSTCPRSAPSRCSAPGSWSFTAMRDFPLGGVRVVYGGPPGQAPPGGPGAGVRAPVGSGS